MADTFTKGTKRVLIVEDDGGFRDVLTLGLRAEGIDAAAAGSLMEAKDALGRDEFAAVISDMRLGQESGLELLAWMKERGLDIPSVIMTAFATTETTVQALSLGAVDFLTKAKNDIHELVKAVQGILAKSSAMEPFDGEDVGDFVGISDSIRRIQALIGKYAVADATVLITGESGTGKEVAARLIHRYSARGGGPFVAVNCGALPENLLESELFGFEKGSFTGASATKRGLFEEAKGGIIFLDEIGEMPVALQVKLLRVLQELKVRRIGSSEERPVDVRVICATNRNIKELAENGTFRQDLYYRLNILHLELPPLRERLEDLPSFVSHFLSKACKRQGKPTMTLTQDAMEMLSAYSFPGNVRELENIMERFAALGSGGALDCELFPDGMRAEIEAGKRHGSRVSSEMTESGFDLEMYLRACKSFFIRRALEIAGGNKTKAAHMLGMGFRPFRYWVDEAGGPEALPKERPSLENFPLKQQVK
jgi:two-component system response regulator PilR (NtrC family)